MRLTLIRLEICVGEGFPTTTFSPALIKTSMQANSSLSPSHNGTADLCTLISRSEIRQRRTRRTSALPRSRYSPCDRSFTQRHPRSTLSHPPFCAVTYHHVLAQVRGSYNCTRIDIIKATSSYIKLSSSYKDALSAISRTQEDSHTIWRTGRSTPADASTHLYPL